MQIALLLLVPMALLVRAGLMVQIAGGVRSKFAASTAMRLLVEAAVTTLAFWAVGAALAIDTGRTGGWAGVSATYLLSVPSGGEPALAWLTRLPLVWIVGPVLLSAAAERTRWRAVLLAGVLLGGVAAPVLIRAAGHPWLVERGLGGTALGLLLVAAGAAGVTAAAWVGPRSNKFNRDGSANHLPPHHVPLLVTGGAVVWAAWGALVPLGAGDSARVAASIANTLIGSAGALLAGAVMTRIRFGKVDVGLTMAALFGGLAATSAGAGVLSSWQAALAGVAAGLLVPRAVWGGEFKLRLDDVNGLAVAALLGGCVGMVVTVAGLPDTSHARLPVVAVAAGLTVAACGAGFASVALAYTVCRAFGGVRVSPTAEYDGADLSELDLNAYPDFQQTMIKSYHMREM